MRKRVKDQLTELLQTMLESCDEINNSVASGEKPVTLLEDCQNAAIRVGESIEASEGEGTQAVSCLEKYCEVLFHISEDAAREELGVENIANMVKNHVAELKSLLQATEKEINKFPKTLEVVFFPYKASMWDSLESIWMAADEDPRCHAVVVPIPYVDRNPDGSVKEEHYEINLYPEEVPVIDYRSYPLDEIHPDIAFIHNPYDEKNLVTSVHPNYYSWRLKEHTDCLVYVPYFALPGNLDKNYSDFSAYHHVNYIVTQTPEHRKSFPSELPDDMFLPFGSPKFDAIIRKCKNPKPIPEAWRAKMEGKRTFFYNTSLRCAINEPDDYLKKMGEVFKAFAGRDDVCLIWRPHPLLEATFDSMQPEYAKVFRGLRELYIKQNIGIYDDTPCMEDTISWCDAYLGDEGSSVVSSFGMAEKPIFILNNANHQKPNPKDYLGMVYRQIYDSEGDDRWVVTAQDELWHSPKNDYHYEFVCNLVDEYKTDYRDYYGRAKEINGKVYILPNNAQNVLVYEDGQLREIPLCKKLQTYGAFSGGLFTKKYIWLVPMAYPEIVRIDLTTEDVAYSKEARDFLVHQGSEGLVRGGMNYSDTTAIISSPTTDEVMFLDADTLEYEVLSLGFKDWKGSLGVSLGYRTYQSDQPIEDELWMLPMEGNDIIRFLQKNKKSTRYSIKPQESTSLSQISIRPFGNVLKISDEKVLLSPALSNDFVLLDLTSGKSEVCNAPYETELQSESIDMQTGKKGSFVAGRRSALEKGKIRFADYSHMKLYDVDAISNDVREIEIAFDEKYIKGKYGGFKREYLYCYYENMFNNLDDMLLKDAVSLGYNPDEQKEVNARITCSSNGDCGKKVIDFLKERNV